MDAVRLAYLGGPLAVRDVVGGSAAVVVCAMSLVLGCAFASGGTLIWFAFLGAAGAASLSSGIPAFLRVERILCDCEGSR